MYKNDVIAYKPDYLFHIGAFTDLEFCELNPEDTYITNFISVQNAVKISNNLSIVVKYSLVNFCAITSKEKIKRTAIIKYLFVFIFLILFFFNINNTCTLCF